MSAKVKPGLLLLVLIGGLVLRAGAAAEPTTPADTPQPPAESTLLDDPTEPLQPVKKRGSLEEDRVRALALFTAARVAEQNQDYRLALRNYERALRMDPQAVAALREIVPLAFNLDRQQEAMRYALLLAEQDTDDAVLLRRLASYLTEEGDHARALKLYERALPILAKDKPTANLVLLRMEMGRLYFVAQNFTQAAHQFGEVLKALESPREFGLDATMQKALIGKAELTYQLFGESFLEAGRAAEALAVFEKANEAKPDEGLKLFNLARVDLKRKQPAQALDKLQTYLDKHFSAQGTGPYRLYAEALSELGQEAQLLARLETAHAVDPDNLPLVYFLAQRDREAGQLDKAEPLYLALLDRNKSRPPLEAYQALIDIYRQQKDAAKLLGVLGDAVGRVGNFMPLGAPVKALLADAALSQALLDQAQSQLQAEPANVSFGTLLAAGLIAIEGKNFAAVNTFFEAAIKAQDAKPSEALITWGLELFMANQYAEAARIFQRGLADKILPEDNPSLHFYLAGALEMSGRTDEAIAAAHKAAEMKKDSARFRSRVAWIQYHAKRYEAARQAYLELLSQFDKDHDSPETRDALRDARLVLSNLAVIENKPAESEEWLEQVLDEFPDDTGALNDLGYLWTDSGKHLERSLAMIRLAVGKDPKNMAYRDSLGWALFRLGRFGEAIAELKAASAVDEPDGTILDHLGDAQLASGDAAAAQQSWRLAASAFEKRSEGEKVKLVREKIAQAASPATEK